MNWKLDFGPWKTLLEGKFMGHSVEILENTENFYLTITYDERDNKKIGALVEGYKALVARGPAESFIQTLPKPAMIIEKTLGEDTYKLFFVSTNSIYIDFRQEDYLRKIDLTLKKGLDEVGTVKELARASSLELRELSMSPESEYASLIGDPFTTRALLSGLKKSALELLDLGEGSIRTGTTKIQLGLNKQREVMKEQNNNLALTLITGKGKGVLYAMYIIAENFLLDNTTSIIFDDNDYFSELGTASKNEALLKDELIEFEPAGFPVKKYTAKKDLTIPLGESNLYLLMKLIGVGEEDFAKKLAVEGIQKTFDTTKELIAQINKMDELNPYQKLKAERIMNIVEQEYPRLFGKGITIEEMTKKWPGNLGRATILDTKELTNNEKIIFEQTIIKMFDKKVREGLSNEIILFIPDADKTLSPEKETLKGMLKRLEDRGTGFVFGSEKVIPELDDLTKTRIDMINGKDAAVSVKGEKSYRVFLRSSLSGAPTIS